MNLKQFETIKEKYGLYGSWAIWADAGEKPKSNIGDLSVFDILKNTLLFDQLKPHIIFIGLNISRGLIKESFANFHDSQPQGTDFKIRYALKGSAYWGAYMTDIFKDLEEKDSHKVKALINADQALVANHLYVLRQEIRDVLGDSGIRATLVAFGDIVYDKLREHFSEEYDVKKIPHYASQNFNNKDRYREAAAKSLAL